MMLPTIAEWTGPSGIVPSHPIGPGLMAAFFAIIDQARDHPILSDHRLFQYSWSYFGFMFATLFYFLAGIALYLQAFEKLLGSHHRKWIIFLSLSFGLPFYILYRPTMGHSYEFFALALVTWATILQSLVGIKTLWRYTFCCGTGIWLTLLIRPANLQVFVLPLILWGLIYIKKPVALQIGSLVPPPQLLMKSALSLIICFLPITILYKTLYGVYYPSSADMYRVGVYFILPIHSLSDSFNALTTLIRRLPQLGTILLSSEFRLLYPAPILVFCIGLVFAILLSHIKSSAKLSVLIATIFTAFYCFFPLIIVLFWQSPADSYGYPFLFCYFPSALFGFLVWLDDYKKNSTAVSFSRKLILFAFLILFSFSLFSNIMYGINEQLQYKEGADSFGVKKESAVGYHPAVLQSIFHKNNIINLAAKRAPGFFVFGVINSLNFDIEQLALPNHIKQKIKEVILNNKPPLTSYLQGFLLMLLFINCISISLFPKNLSFHTQ